MENNRTFKNVLHVSAQRSDDTSGIGKQGPVTHINVVSGRHNDKDREKKTWPTRSSNSVVFTSYLAKGLHKDENKL